MPEPTVVSLPSSELAQLIHHACVQAVTAAILPLHHRHTSLLQRITRLDTLLTELRQLVTLQLSELETEIHSRLKHLERQSRFVDENGDPIPVLWRRLRYPASETPLL